MARRTVHIPDELDERVADHGTADDSYSGIVQDALEEFLADRENDAAEQPAK